MHVQLFPTDIKAEHNCKTISLFLVKPSFHLSLTFWHSINEFPFISLQSLHPHNDVLRWCPQVNAHKLEDASHKLKVISSFKKPLFSGREDDMTRCLKTQNYLSFGTDQRQENLLDLQEVVYKEDTSRKQMVIPWSSQTQDLMRRRKWYCDASCCWIACQACYLWLASLDEFFLIICVNML